MYKKFSVDQCDGDGFSLENEQFIVEKNTVWNVPEDRDYRLVGGDVRLENDDLGWIEIANEDLQECFKRGVIMQAKRRNSSNGQVP